MKDFSNITDFSAEGIDALDAGNKLVAALREKYGQDQEVLVVSVIPKIQ